MRFVRLHCRYHAEPQPRVEWLFNGSQLYAGDHVTLSGNADQSALTIDHVTLLDTGEYVCSATNALGQATTKTFLRVRSTLSHFCCVSGFKGSANGGAESSIFPAYKRQLQIFDRGNYGCSNFQFCHKIVQNVGIFSAGFFLVFFKESFPTRIKFSERLKFSHDATV